MYSGLMYVYKCRITLDACALHDMHFVNMEYQKCCLWGERRGEGQGVAARPALQSRREHVFWAALGGGHRDVASDSGSMRDWTELNLLAKCVCVDCVNLCMLWTAAVFSTCLRYTDWTITIIVHDQSGFVSMNIHTLTYYPYITSFRNDRHHQMIWCHWSAT